MPQTRILVFRNQKKQIPLQKWLKNLEKKEPRAYAKCLERITRLGAIGNEMRRPLADSLRDGIRELRARIGNVNYRILYFFLREAYRDSLARLDKGRRGPGYGD